MPYTLVHVVSIDSDCNKPAMGQPQSSLKGSTMSLPEDAAPVTFILTTDRVRAKPFYAGVLGLRIVAEDDFAVTFDLGNGASMRLTDLPDHEAKGHTVLGWSVPNIEAAVSRLKAMGITFRVFDSSDQDQEGIWTAPGGSARVAWFADPDGNVLSLTQFE
jgi:catechol 2,3-dioxygenase-like lactoylglutathione lyase family enzyme